MQPGANGNQRTPPLPPAGYLSIKHTKGIAYLGPLRVSHASDHISPPSARPGAGRRGQQATGLRRAAQGAASVQRSMADKSIRPDDKKAQRQYSRILHGARDTLRYSRRVTDVQRADSCTTVVYSTDSCCATVLGKVCVGQGCRRHISYDGCSRYTSKPLPGMRDVCATDLIGPFCLCFGS